MDHFWFIAGAYGVSALVMAALVAWVVLDGRSLARRLKALDARGIRRRSQAGQAPAK
jgi:heme exporter protein D